MNRIPESTIAGLIISIIICFALPIAGYIWSRVKYGKTLKPFIFGSLAFFVSQIILRIPIIQVILPRFAWYTVFATSYYNLYCLFLGLTAGIFEEAARFVAVKFLLKNNRGYGDGIAFGFGHGGIEAVLIVGLTFIEYFVYAIAINNGSFGSLLGSATQVQRDYLSAVLYNLDFVSALSGGLERIIAVAMHIGMTMIVFRGFAVGRPGLYLLSAITAHTVIDTLCGILPQIGVTGLALEGVFAVFSAALIVYAIWTKRHTSWPKREEGVRD